MEEAQKKVESRKDASEEYRKTVLKTQVPSSSSSSEEEEEEEEAGGGE